MFTITGKFSVRRAPPNKLAFPPQRNQSESVTLASLKSPKNKNNSDNSRHNNTFCCCCCVSFFNSCCTVVLKFLSPFFAVFWNSLLKFIFLTAKGWPIVSEITPISATPLFRCAIKCGVYSIDKISTACSRERSKKMYARAIFLTLACLAVLLGSPVNARSADEWKSRIIYQVQY